MAKIKIGDEVIVLSGKDKGKRGKVIERIPAEGKVVVEGVNIVTRHIRPTRRGQESGIVKKEAPLFQSKVMLICPRCGKKTRVGMRILKTGEKLRYCKKCKEVVD